MKQPAVRDAHTARPSKRRWPKPPALLYKFTSPETGLRILQSNQLRYTAPREFNDPFDCARPVHYEGDAKALERHMVPALQREYGLSPTKARREAKLLAGSATAEVMQGAGKRIQAANQAELGVVCLTERRDDLLMWAHYAASHSGVCFGFSTEHSPFRAAFPVSYRDMRPVREYTAPDKDPETEMEESVLVKSKHWEYECEWRLVRHLLGMGVGPGLAPFMPASLREIILGSRLATEHRRLILATVEMRSAPVSLFSAIPDDRHFRLNIVPLQP